MSTKPGSFVWYELMTSDSEAAAGAHQAPTGQWIAQCEDPQGAYFALLSSTR
ncbi:MAG: hypothetical protein IPM02_19030 [Betaproteobacteria bacterium]|nr:hypothetical protein [Betaproteobacteria bacterium]